jgi:transposase
MSPSLEDLTPEMRCVVEPFVAAERLRGEKLEAENRILRELIRLLHLKKYGPKSEQLSDRQLQLLEGEPSVTPEEVAQEAARVGNDPRAREPRVPKRDRQHPGRVELPAHLERRIEVIPVPAQECRCPRCQKELPVIGFEEAEYLDMEPVKYFVRQVRREKRAATCGCVEGVVCAPVPQRILPKSKFGDEVILDFIDNKFGQHLPVYRQCDTMWREAGIELSRQTVCGVIGQVGTLLEAIRQSLRRNLIEDGYIQADETPIGVQSPEVRGRNHTGRIWHYGRPGGPVVIDFQMSRGREGPLAFLEGFRGTLQSDGYGAYDKLGQGIRYAGCLAHVRRKLTDAHKLSPDDPVPRELLDQIGAIYAVEAEARDAQAGPDDRRTLRQARSRPLMDALKEQLVRTRAASLPKSVLGRACAYALGQWTRLEVFLDDGRVEADNNWAENALRPVVLGRKNFLHVGSEWAGPRLAAIWSVYGTCQRLGKNPRAYLRSILPRLADWPIKRVDELSPLVWQA